MTNESRASLGVLGEDEVDVWVARPLDVSDACLARCLEVLPDDERAHVARFRFDRHRREAAVTRALVRLTLARYVGRPARSFAYRSGLHGRPHLEPPCGIAFNASNHPDLVACAVSRSEEIGVDVEPVSRGEEILGVAQTVFSAPELEALYALPRAERPERAVSLWTCKEAYVKARGLGLTAPLENIVVDFPPRERPFLHFLRAADEPAGWWLDTRDVLGCRLAVAVRGASENVRLVVRTIDWDDAAPLFDEVDGVSD